MPWPAVGPDVTGGNVANVGGHVYHNPAANCYLNILGGHTDGSSGVLSFDASNCYSSTPTVSIPFFSPTPNSFGSTQHVSVTDSTPGSSIFCTTDGSTPTPSSTPYSGPFTVSSTTTIQCMAIAVGYTNSGVGGGQYIITNGIYSASHCSQAGVNTVNCSVTVPAGALITVEGSDRNGLITSVSDSINGTYTNINYVSDSANPAWGGLWYFTNAEAGTYNVQLNVSASDPWSNISVQAWAGAATSNVLDTASITQYLVNLTNSTTPTCGSANAPTGNNELVPAVTVFPPVSGTT